MKPPVILDAGHSIEMQGNRSPIWRDGSQLMEYEFNRDIVRRIASMLDALELPYHILVGEDTDIPLSERCKRANIIWKSTEKNSYLISVHANAGGGTGWECFTSVGETKSDAIATIFCEEASKAFVGKRMRFDYSDGAPDKECAILYLASHTLSCDIGRDAIARMHLEAIKQIESIYARSAHTF